MAIKVRSDLKTRLCKKKIQHSSSIMVNGKVNEVGILNCPFMLPLFIKMAIESCLDAP